MMSGRRATLKNAAAVATLTLIVALAVTVLVRVTSSPPDTQPAEPTVLISRTAVLAENLEIPWALDFLPGGDIILTERPGRIRLFIPGRGLADEPLLTLPHVEHRGEGGLLGLALHPSYPDSPYLYVYYTYRDNNALANRVVRFTLQDRQLTDEEVLLDGIPGANVHNGGRIKFGPDGKLFITTGDARNPELSQSPDSLGGKILRITAEGGIPDDNPFAGSPVYSLGHRNPQGLAWDDAGRLWSTEHGAAARDELNLIEPGLNYGWPVIEGDQTMRGMETPVVQSGRETWAPSGLAHVDGEFFFVGLRGQSLYQVVPDEDFGVIRHLQGEFGRLREAVVGPDGNLYLLTSNRDGRGRPVDGDDRLIRVELERR